MVAKGHRPGDLPLGGDIDEEALRPGDGGDGKDTAGRAGFHAPGSGQGVRASEAPNHAKSSRDPEAPGDPVNGVAILRRHQQRIGAGSSRDWLAQPARRQGGVGGIGWVNQEQIDVSRQPEVLESVVEEVHGGCRGAARPDSRDR